MKYEVSRLRYFWVIVLQQSVDRRTDRQTDGRIDKVITCTIGLLHLRWRGPNKKKCLTIWQTINLFLISFLLSYLPFWYCLTCSGSYGIIHQNKNVICVRVYKPTCFSYHDFFSRAWNKWNRLSVLPNIHLQYSTRYKTDISDNERYISRFGLINNI